MSRKLTAAVNMSVFTAEVHRRGETRHVKVWLLKRELFDSKVQRLWLRPCACFVRDLFSNRLMVQDIILLKVSP